MGKLIIVDDHQLFRAGLIKIFKTLPGYEVIAEADTGEQAIKLVLEKEPDMVLMDISMQGMGSLEVIKRMKRIQQDIKILIVTDCVSAPYPARAIRAGADGYFSKCDCPVNLIRAVQTIMAGQHYITANVAQEMALKSHVDYLNPFESLSEREFQVMSLITQCYKVRDIAEQLYLSPKTVNTYRYRIYGKLGVDSDVGMAIMAMHHGMLPTGTQWSRKRSGA